MEDGLHLEWPGVGQQESFPMESVFPNRLLLGNSRIRGFLVSIKAFL